MPVCAHCGSRFNVQRKDQKFFDLGTPDFCSPGCLRSYVEELPALPKNSPVNDAITAVPADLMMDTPMCYSALLHTNFRSGFEVLVAESIVRGWGWSVLYEPDAIRMPKGKLYIPDFRVMYTGVWLEVKGCWHSGGQA